MSEAPESVQGAMQEFLGLSVAAAQSMYLGRLFETVHEARHSTSLSSSRRFKTQSGHVRALLAVC